MKFRADINGLRAIAVIAVIFFHINPKILPGGFIGVDIFFVISGYLMTGIIFTGLENKNFSIISFYIRRARRIIPALAFLCLTLLFFAFFFIVPKDAKELGKHAFSSLLFYSNYVYLNEINYFNELSNQKWLLHTWSLSVEWQFYILYPIALIFAHKILGTKRTKLFVILCTIIGFVLNLYLSQKNTSASFYLLPARFWEMLLGGLAYLYPLKNGLNERAISKIAQTLIILITIVSFFYINNELKWPGYYALIPVISTYLIILLNSNTVILDNQFMQKTGKYSYSLYLWHWPVLVAFFYLQIQFNYLWYALLIVGLSFIGYQLTERKRLSSFSTAVLFGFAVMGSLFVWGTQGLSFRVPQEFRLDAKQYHRKYYGGSGYKANTPIAMGSTDKEKTKIIFTGDSFSLQYASYLDEHGKLNDIKYEGIFSHGCLILPNYTRYRNGEKNKNCAAMYDKLHKLVENNSSPIVFAFNWGGYTKLLGLKNEDKQLKINENEFFEIIKTELAQMFSELGNRDYYLVGVPQRAKEHAYTCLARMKLIGNKLMGQACTEKTQQQPPNINKILKSIAAQYSNVYYIEPNDVLCHNKECMTILNNKPIHSDYSHLSIYGAELVGKYILEKINEF